MIKKVKIIIKKVQSTKVTKVVIAKDNTKRTLIKTTYKKEELNEIPNKSTAILKEESHL